jgi:hypothetical protein
LSTNLLDTMAWYHVQPYPLARGPARSASDNLYLLSRNHCQDGATAQFANQEGGVRI